MRSAAQLAVVGLGVLACQGVPVDVGGPSEPAPAAAELSLGSLAPGGVLDLGSEGGPNHVVSGFSLPERVGSRRVSWSEGEVATVAFNLRGGAPDYQVVFIAEAYHLLGEVPVSLTVNKRPAGEAQVGHDWRAYRLVASGASFNAGRNELAFQLGKTGKPSELEPPSSDQRELGVCFEQIQVQPIGASAELMLGGQNAFALAALGEGWVRDAGDRGTGTWTLGERAALTFHLAKADAPGYRLALSARAPRGARARRVTLSLNGASLDTLAFDDKKQTSIVEVPTDRLRFENELAFEFEQLEPPAELDPTSKDTRPLGLRVFELNVTPR